MSTTAPSTGTPAGGQQPPGWQDLGIVRRRGMRGWLRRHPRTMNLIVSAIYVFLSAWSLPGAFIDMGADAWWLGAVQAVIAAALLFRHRWPVGIAAAVVLGETAGIFVYPWQGAQMVGLCFAIYCVGLHRGLVRGLVVGVAGTVVAYLPLLRADAWLERYDFAYLEEIFNNGSSPHELLIPMVIIMALSVGISGGIGAAVRRGRSHEREVLEWASRSHELAQVAERNRIAREMHDVVAHSLSVMISLADGARVVVRRDPERAAEVLGEVSSTGRTALADMRRVIGVLRQGDGVDRALRPARESLEELYEGFRRAGMPLTVTTQGPPLPDDVAFGLTVHRIIQESLTNVLRYGRQVTAVQVRIEHRPGSSEEEAEALRAEGLEEDHQAALGITRAGQVIITVTDDGLSQAVGSRVESVGSGQGIRGMNERAAFFSGSVYAGPGRHRGWTVRAVLEPPQPTSAGRGTG
ncbi:sensor histidine kinase [Nesterenkonia xinjiangensis]|uniref:histidine kinase n=1 Tax=Nesterenkonia xinjiangensis TaxID=225327 RepID=A0A7Z0GL82_9MICC|nr:histidine kinase [Nesterenkonia xinjiangensis]NYJ77980.1 signal transduction histidine kinase [Nesterenkonia xinjiangensis]